MPKEKSVDNESAKWEADFLGARQGSLDALGRLLESCRNYLLLLANQQLRDDLQAKASGSDLVQETFLEAQRDFRAFHGRTEEELLGWLRRILLNNLGAFSRHYRNTKKRTVQREVSLDKIAERPEVSADLPAFSQQPAEAIQSGEASEQLEAVLARLPERYRQVVLLRQRGQFTFAQIGQVMQRSEAAVEKMWLRALERLKQELGPTV
jgi:RNA polymerase sigma-70 factor (ECF subfamily)